MVIPIGWMHIRTVIRAITCAQPQQRGDQEQVEYFHLEKIPGRYPVPKLHCLCGQRVNKIHWKFRGKEFFHFYSNMAAGGVEDEYYIQFLKSVHESRKFLILRGVSLYIYISPCFFNMYKKKLHP